MDSLVQQNSQDGTSNARDAGFLNSSRRGTRRYVIWALCCGGLIVFGWEASYVLLGPNFHCVAPANAYRSGQPNAGWLDRAIDQHGIRSVINLRGDGHDSAWYLTEREVAEKRGVHFENVMLSASFAPHPRDLRRLVRVLDNAPRPVLFHCRSGGDRSGFTAAIFLLLYTDAPLDEARGQLSWRYGHYRYGRSACLHGPLDQYEEWLTAQELEHRPEYFRRWITRVYRLPV